LPPLPPLAGVNTARSPVVGAELVRHYLSRYRDGLAM